MQQDAFIEVEEGAKPAETPVVEAPTTETPVVETTETPAGEKPTENQFGWLETHNVKNEDDLKALISERDFFKQQFESKSAETPIQPYKTDFARIADELSQKGVAPTTIAKFYNLDASKLSDKDAILQKMEVDYPDFNAAQLQGVYQEKYGEVENPNSLLTEGQKTAKLMELRKEADGARTALSQYVFDALNPNQVSPQVQAKEQERKTFWEQSGFSKLTPIQEYNANGKMKLPETGGVKEVEHSFTFQLSEQKKQALQQELRETVSNPAFADAFANNETGIQKANEVANRLFWASNGEEVAKSALAYAAEREAKIHEHYAKMMNNTSFGTAATTSTSKEVSVDEGMATFLKKAINQV